MNYLALAVIGGFAFLTQPSFAAEPPAGFIMNGVPEVLPEIQFEDENGRPGQLADFRGKIVLLNLWATWCAPCREEMPTLDRLQSKLGGPDFEVVALSIDRNGLEKVQAFYRDIGIQQLAVRVDGTAKAARILGAPGLPTTILIDREGRDLGRLLGPAAWDTEEMLAFFESIVRPPENNLQGTE